MEISPEVNKRIDDVLSSNGRHEILILILSVLIFIFGMITLIYGIMIQNVYIVAPSMVINGLLYWPIYTIKNIRKENITLAVAPTLIATLPPAEAARELIKLLDKITK